MANKTINKKFVKWKCLTVVWIMVIFAFSMQSGTESSELSGGIVDWLIELVFNGEFAYAVELGFLTRKVAHFTEYLVLGVLVTHTVKQTNCFEQVFVIVVVSVLVCVCVAACDETIQLFSEGRSGQVVDVVLDSCGALCGVTWCCMRTV